MSRIRGSHIKVTHHAWIADAAKRIFAPAPPCPPPYRTTESATLPVQTAHPAPPSPRAKATLDTAIPAWQLRDVMPKAPRKTKPAAKKTRARSVVSSRKGNLATAWLGETGTGAKHFDFFLSYKSEDSKVARSIYEILTRGGYCVFMDVRNLPPGANLLPHLTRALELSQRILVVASPQYTESDWTQYEVEHFFTLDKLRRDFRIIPVEVEASKLPGFIAALLTVRLYELPPRDWRTVLLERLKLLPTLPLSV